MDFLEAPHILKSDSKMRGLKFKFKFKFKMRDIWKI